MSEFQEKHTVSRLIGSPPGYVGYGEGGVLTEAVRQRPYSVVLLDEVREGRTSTCMNLFYQVFDKGMLSDGEGREIDFTNTVIILTSNLATDVITEMTAGDDKPDAATLLSAVRPILSNHFKPALLARMTVVPYFPLATDALARHRAPEAGQDRASRRAQQQDAFHLYRCGGRADRGALHGGRDGRAQHRFHSARHGAAADVAGDPARAWARASRCRKWRST